MSNPPAGDPAGATSVLSRLSDAERRVLLLLAEGHTAKSIAVTLGTSVHSVNERLRDARRKTGAGSSREIARLLRLQENWDKQIGVFATAAPVDHPTASPPQRVRGRFVKGMAVMGTGGAILSAMIWMLAAQVPSPADDPMLGYLASGNDNDPTTLFQAIRSEARDVAWADATERQLRARFARLVAESDAGTLRVTCAHTLCEVAGEIARIRDGEAVALQRLGLTGLSDIGLRSASFSIGRGRTAQRVAFANYLRRVSP